VLCLSLIRADLRNVIFPFQVPSDRVGVFLPGG
jgi:hypothetical protein